jgi:hypothetical protein
VDVHDHRAEPAGPRPGALTASETTEGSLPVWNSGRRSWFVAFDVNLPGEAPCPSMGSAP